MKWNRAKVVVSFFVVALLIGFGFPSAVFGQRLDGDLRGVVKDPTGALVPGGSVTVTNQDTGVAREVETTGAGGFFVGSLLPGFYRVEVTASGFKHAVKEDVEVIANRLSEVIIELELGAVAETVIVERGRELVTTTSATLVGATFKEELTGAVAAVTLDSDPINLAITAPGTTTQSGGVVGVGGSIGGNRPRMNNFVIDGLDNNDPSVTGPLTPVIADSVAEFTLLTNQFTAEYGHSTAGQFITTTKSGTNDIHGRGWLYIQNRELNSLDNLQDRAEPKPKFDWQRFGGQAGGPIIRDKWFFFASYERQELDLSATPLAEILVPTSAGRAALQALAADPTSGVSPVNAGIILDQVPTATTATASTDVFNEGLDMAVPIELGPFRASAPDFDRVHRFFIGQDVVTPRHRFSGRFFFSRSRQAIPGELPVPQFTSPVISDSRRVTFSDVFSISPTVVNEFRLAYLRSTGLFALPSVLPPAPGATDIFANYNMPDINLFIGPQGNFPQGGFDNIYQVTNNTSWVRGAHTVKAGVEFRKIISPTAFLPRSRGEYEWVAQAALGQLSDMDAMVRDFFPSSVSIRGVGLENFAQNREQWYGFVQDSWKVHPRVNLEFGLRYEFTQVARDSNLQNLNGIASILSLTDEVWTQEIIDSCFFGSGAPFCVTPFGTFTPTVGDNIFNDLPPNHQAALLAHIGNQLIFKKPNADRNNFAPRLGLAWDVFGDGKTSLRAGFAIAHDVTFGNLPLLQLPPQAQAESREGNACTVSPPPAWCAAVVAGGPALSPGISFSGIGFIEGGGIGPQLPGEALTSPIIARNFTGAFIPDEKSPETYTWSLSLQREVFNRLLVEARYVGTHAIHLPTQRWVSARVPNPARIPAFASPSEVPTDFTGRPTLGDFQANRTLMLSPFGFQGVITQFSPDSRSSYHGGSISVRGNVGAGLFLNSNYTWSRTIDNIENDLFTSFMNPRRPWDMINIFEGRGLSGLHHEHKFVLSWSWKIPAYKGDVAAARKVLDGWNIAGTFIAETGQPLTFLSRRDTNGDFDTAGDRAFVNTGASGFAGSDVSPVCWNGVAVDFTCSVGNIVAYVADDPSARFVRPGTGSFPAGSLGQLGRNTFRSPGINNWNVSIAKNTPFWGEGRYIRFQADFINMFNHPSFIIGNGSVFPTTANATGAPGYVTPGTTQFRDKRIFSGGLGQGPFQRVIQLSLKVIF